MIKKILALSVMVACAITFCQTAIAQTSTGSTVAIQPSALLTVVSPNGGEIITQHSNTTVMWTADPSLQSFTVQLLVRTQHKMGHARQKFADGNHVIRLERYTSAVHKVLVKGNRRQYHGAVH
ncbi:MAG: hypothetical protein IPP40_10165 [bacterium]|nr:hypothetical protein [bacterium]